MASIESESPSEPEPPGERTASSLAQQLRFGSSFDEHPVRRKVDERSLLCDVLSGNLTNQTFRWGENRSGRLSTSEGFTFTYYWSRCKEVPGGMVLRLSDGNVGFTHDGIRFSDSRGRFDYANLTVEVTGNGGVARGAVDIRGFCRLQSDAIRHGAPLTFRVSDESARDVPAEEVEGQVHGLVNGARGQVDQMLKDVQLRAGRLARRDTHQPVASVRIPWADAENIKDAIARAREEQAAAWRVRFPGVEWGE